MFGVVAVVGSFGVVRDMVIRGSGQILHGFKCIRAS